MSDGRFQNHSRQSGLRPAEQSRQPAEAQPASRQAAQSQQQTDAHAAPGAKAPDLSAISVPETAPKANQKSGRKVAESIHTAGRAGERHITLESTEVSVGNSLSCYFTVGTAPGNGLEITIEQGSYRKTWQGSASVVTGVLPVGPIGLRGKVSVRDTTSGETFEERYHWYPLHGGLDLWGAIKRLLWKSGA